MALNLDQVLSWTFLTNTVRLKKPGVPDVLPEKFFSTKQEISGDKVAYVALYGTRKLANRVPFGGTAKRISKVPLSEVNVRLVQIKNQIVFDQEMVNVIRQFDKYEEQAMRCINLLEEQGEQFRVRFDNTRKTSLAMFLAHGKNWWDADGNLLNSASGAFETIDQGITTNNVGSIVDPESVGGKIVNSPWTNPATDIVGQLRNLKTLALKRSGYEPKYAMYGRNVAGYLMQNESARAYWQFDIARNQTFLNEYKIPAGFMGFEWIPVQDAFYEDESGAQKEVFDPDKITFFPEVSKDTYTLFEGTTLVPGLFGTYADGVAALRAGKDQAGMGRFAYWQDAQQIVDVGFDCFLPKFKVPDSVFIMDTTP
jgi:hypothetical protein